MAAGQAFTLFLRQRLRIGREDHPGLATNFAGQFGGDPAHRRARVIHILCLHQPRKGLRLIQHGINVLGLRQVWALPPRGTNASF